MKRNLALIMAAMLALSACGSGSGTTQTTAAAASAVETTAAAQETEAAETEKATAAIEVDKNLLTVDINISAEMAEQMGIKEGDTAEGRFNKVVKNDDGSFTITMTRAKHKEMMDELRGKIEEGLQEMTDSDDYCFTNIDANADYTEFTVSCANDTLNMTESLSTIAFYMYGGMYNAFNGTPADNVHVDFVTEDGSVISSADSKNLGGSGEDAAEETETAAETEAVEDTAELTELVPSEPVTIEDKCKFALDYAKFNNDVMPPSPGDWYSHYEAGDGKTFADICISYKNLASGDIGADKVMDAKLIYKNNYEFKGFSTIEKDSRSDFTYTNITSISPLTTEYVHYLIEVPEEVETSEGSAVIIVTVCGQEYKVTLKEGTDDTVNKSEAGKTSGEIVDKETIVTKDAEFSVDFCNITNDVIPPAPADWYSHYEADDGKVYVDLCFAYTNTTSKAVGADKVISAKLKYAGKYDYTGFTTIEKSNRGDFTYTNITGIDPLTTEYVHYLFEVPSEVAESEEPIVCTITVDGNEYTYNVR